MTERSWWRVPVRGPLPDDAIGRLTAAGIQRLGGSSYVSAAGGVGQEQHGLYLEAESAAAAAAKVRDALGDLPHYIAEDEVKPFDPGT